MTITSTFCISNSQDCVFVRVTGHGTREHSPAFVEEVTAAVQQSPDQTLIVDVEHCDYLDSTFLGALVTLFRKTETRMSVCASDDQKERLFSSARIDRLIPVQQPETVTFPDEWRTICGEIRDDVRGLVEQVVESHRSLADIEGPNADVYRHVADQLEGEMRSRRIE